MTVELDPLDARRVRHAPAPLRAFNDAGVLDAADVHVALRLMALGGESDASVTLAAALAVRGPRCGHVYVDLATIRDQATVDEADEPVDLAALPWPAAPDWMRALRRSTLVAVGEGDGAPSPLRLVGTALYLDRYWREERQIAADLRAFGQAAAAGARIDVLADGLRRLFPGQADDSQRLAAASATLRRFAVVAGGPGTGKTTTVARILALLGEQAASTGAPAPLVALAAPTGKAAARLEETVHSEASGLQVEEPISAQLLAVKASTLHRLLGWRPGSHSRFRHDRSNRLAHDVVIVDESSMVSLSLMARLVEAVRPDARLILVGDPGQLTSIEAGAVLGDIVGPAAGGLLMRPPARRDLERAVGHEVSAHDPPTGAAFTGASFVPATDHVTVTGAPASTGVGDGIVVLDRLHRFGGGIAALATAVRSGDVDATIAALRAGTDDVTWIDVDVAEPDDPDALAAVREGAVAAAHDVMRAAAAGDTTRAIEALGAFRLLCAHRRGAHGATTWRGHVERWLSAEIDGFAAQGEWYVGRPLLVTENDYGLQLYNGDTGVVIAAEEGRVSAAFERRGEIMRLSPTRLDVVDTVYAMTIHKAQGSQFETAAVLLPPASSPILTRELLYTGVTRARTHLIVAGASEAVRAAVLRPVARASGLRSRLWKEG